MSSTVDPLTLRIGRVFGRLVCSRQPKRQMRRVCTTAINVAVRRRSKRRYDYQRRRWTVHAAWSYVPSVELTIRGRRRQNENGEWDRSLTFTISCSWTLTTHCDRMIVWPRKRVYRDWRITGVDNYVDINSAISLFNSF